MLAAGTPAALSTSLTAVARVLDEPRAARCGRCGRGRNESRDVVRSPGGLLDLTATGRVRREVVRQKIREVEKLFLAEIPESEIAIGRRFLKRLIAKQSVAPSS